MYPTQAAGFIPASNVIIPYVLKPLVEAEENIELFANQQTRSDIFSLFTPSSLPAQEYTQKEPQESSVQEAEEFDSLLEIIQNQTLTLAQKNMRFACQLKNRQLSCFKKIQLLTEFTTKNLTLAIGSANDGLPIDNEAVARESLPFYVLESTALTANATREHEKSRIDFDKIVLPKALQKEINSDSKMKEKAGIKEIVTLQDWACGTIRSFNVQLSDPIPSLCADSYSVVTFAPLKEELLHDQMLVKRGHWDPFFKAGTGPKVLLTYIDDTESEQAQGGTSGIVTQNGKYVVIQDSTKKKQHWSVEPISDDEASSDSTLAKIKRTAVNFVIIPIKAVALLGTEPSRYGSPGRSVGSSSIALSKAGIGRKEASRQTYTTIRVPGPHKVDAEGTVHVQVHTVPIDVGGLQTKADLQRYMKRLGKIVLKLIEIKPLETVADQVTAAIQDKPLATKTVTNLTSLAAPKAVISISSTDADTKPASTEQKKADFKKPELIQHIESLFNFIKDRFRSFFL